MINISCRPGRLDCTSAYPLGEGNQVDVTIDEKGAVRIQFSLLNPLAPIRSSIDGEMVVGPQSMVVDQEIIGLIVTQSRENVGFGISVIRDGYPSLEVYRDTSDGNTEVLIQSDEWSQIGGVPWALGPSRNTPWPQQLDRYPPLSYFPVA